MNLSPAQKNRAAAVLLGQAIGDALGVPYEFGPPIEVGTARMIGGGLGPYAPGEWSDDTQMAICIAQESASGVDLSSYDGLDPVAKRFREWRFRGASDIGNQTAAVISAAELMIGDAAVGTSRRSPASLLHSSATSLDDSSATSCGASRRSSAALPRSSATSFDDSSATSCGASRRSPASLLHSSATSLDGSSATSLGDSSATSLEQAAGGAAVGTSRRSPASLLHSSATSCGASRRSSAALPRSSATSFEQAARDYAAKHPRSAGNGALMRNGIIGLTRLSDRQATAAAARAVAALTHADPLVAASCVLHAEAVRVAVLEGRLDIRAGRDLLPEDECAQWSSWIDEAEQADPKSFTGNGFTVTAFQAAWSAIFHTMPADATPDHVNAAVQLAISIGHDTDTVAAIAGALLGARYGVSGLRHDWRQQVHGWPGMDARDLVQLALMTACAGVARPISSGQWPLGATTKQETRTLGVPLPADFGVRLGTEADLPRADELRCDRVVSLSRIGRDERRPCGVAAHLEQWLVDSETPEDNEDLAWALHDAADAVHELRGRNTAGGDDHKVLLHCVRAEHRTPAVALLYAVKHCDTPPEEAAHGIRTALGRSSIDGLLWRTAMAEAHTVAAERRR